MECSFVLCEKTNLGWQSCVSLFTFTSGRGLTFTSARVLVRAHVDGPGFPPTDTLDNTLCAIRALVPTLAVQLPHVCHRQRDWAESIGSHMQHDMNISNTPPHQGASAFTSETTSHKIGDSFP